MRHRLEIDGLRAVAVLPVVFFHAGLAGFEGGYVGVDVFFVISGYLISRILLGELEANDYSIARFYERRARRILPALFLVMFICLPAALWVMTPQLLVAFGESLTATCMFISNAHFAEAAGYFEGPGELQPLLHTWSLAVEEQFYLLFPPLLIAAWRPRWVPHLLVGLFGASLVYAEILNGDAPDDAFFLLPSRTWELMLGSLLAWREHSRGPTPSNSILSLVGLVLVGISIATFKSDTPHPGVWTLLPTVGATLVIAFGRSPATTNRLLANRILVAIGLVSYSLYLWHQPIFALARLTLLTEPSLAQSLAMVALAGALAWLSWRFVEAPFRDRKRVPTRWVWMGAAAASVLLIGAGIGLRASAGLPQRFEAELLRRIDEARPQANRVFVREGERCSGRMPEEACILGARVPPSWALVGDSTAGSLAIAVDEQLEALGESAVQLTRPGCLYLPGFQRRDGRNCPRLSAAFRERLRDPKIRHVILAGRYSFMLTGERFDNGEGGREYGPPRVVVPIDGMSMSEAQRESAALAGYRESVRDLLADGKTVYLVYPIPEVGWHVPDHLFKLRVLRGDSRLVTTSSARFRERTARVVANFDALGESSTLVRIRPSDWLCNRTEPGRCVTELDGEILYADDNHPSLAGARRLVQQLFQGVAE